MSGWIFWQESVYLALAFNRTKQDTSVRKYMTYVFCVKAKMLAGICACSVTKDAKFTENNKSNCPLRGFTFTGGQRREMFTDLKSQSFLGWET